VSRDPSTFRDADARRRILEDLEATLFVEAAAGTGKTTALVGRIVALLRGGRATLDRIVAVTFTEKAAGEMKLRLRAEIERARAALPEASVERVRLDTALQALELARIGTIHAFCAELLRERPVEAGVDPMFAVAPEDESQRLLDRAFDAWFERSLSDPPEGVRRILRRRPRGFGAQGPREALRFAVGSLVEHRDFPASWTRPAFDRNTALDAVVHRLERLAAMFDRAEWPDDWLARNLGNVARFVRENALREDVRGRDYEGLEAELRELTQRRTGWHYKGVRRKQFGEGLTRDEVLEARDAAKQALDDFLAEADADLAACLREELRPVVDEYQSLKAAAGVLDFVDLLLCTRDLIARDDDVRAFYQERYTRFFVDEFQDTDPLQAEILLLLAADRADVTDWRDVTPVPGKLFLVGDPKQSIYRFRRADVAIYERTKARLRERGADLVHLSTSFRALPALQHAVNAAFAPRMQGASDGSQAEYVALEPAREDVEDRPAIVVLPAPRPYGDYGTVVKWKVEESLPDATGAFVAWLVNESGWRVPEGPEGELVNVAPRHVCLLFRRFKSFNDDVTRPYVRALEARRVPHVLVGGRSFHDREEVLAIRNALAAVEWPDDELRVYATLRGPLFALTDEVLLAFRARHRRLHPLLPLDREALPASERCVLDALIVLRDLHRRRNRRPIADTIARLQAAVRAHAGVAIWPTGEQALANTLRTIDLARRFERRGAVSFRAFVERLEADAERGDAEDAPVVEEGTEGVRIMTAHRAKGLEFPVVVLCDPTCAATRKQPSRHVDPEAQLWAEPLCGCAPHDLLAHRDEELARDAAEAVRLAYVASTRARDLLVVPGVGDAEEEGWLDVLNPVVYPKQGERGEAEKSAGVPAFGEDAIVARPRNAKRPSRAPVAPGRLRPREGAHTVVWWDPNRLELDVEQDVGIRQQRILEADESGEVAGESERAHARWQEARRTRLASGGEAAFVVAPVTQIAEASVASATEAGVEAAGEMPGGRIALETVDADRADRPHGKRFGSLVHETLAAVALDDDADAVRAAATLQGRMLGASDAEVAAAAHAANAALAHPVLRRAAASGSVRRETPVLLRREDGSLAEGIVDLAFREGSGTDARWTVVDFKTDRELGERRAAYEAQVGIYVEAIATATGEPAEGLLLVV
jgi:ATP-dependent exoDNAse (exonuclease V) beta subunit